MPHAGPTAREGNPGRMNLVGGQLDLKGRKEASSVLSSGEGCLVFEVPKNHKRFMQPDNGAKRQHDDLPPRELTSVNSAGH
jgi:hypothetical protein